MENKTGKYFKYAVGEIVLVVIGILIALQINNWNEGKKALAIEKELIVKLSKDLVLDIEGFHMNLEAIDDISENHYEIFEIGVKGNQTQEITHPNFIRRLLRYQTIARDNDPFIADKISNARVRDEVLKYYSALSSVDVSYAQFMTLILDKLRPYLGEQGLYDLSAMFTKEQYEDGQLVVQLIKSEDLKAIAADPLFQQLLFEAQLKISETRKFMIAAVGQNQRLQETIEAEIEKSY